MDTLGPHARIAAGRVPPVLATALLWHTFHQMTSPELSQLAQDLLVQDVSPVKGKASVRRRVSLAAATLRADAVRIAAANGAAALSAAVARLESGAQALLAIPDLGHVAPHGLSAARLLRFAAYALTKRDPAAPALTNS